MRIMGFLGLASLVGAAVGEICVKWVVPPVFARGFQRVLYYVGYFPVVFDC